MIPLFIKIGFKNKAGKNRNIWIPLPLLYIPILFLIIILSPLLIIAGIIMVIRKGAYIFKAINWSFRALTASCGLLIDVNSENAKVHLSIQ
jgi:hypothetical protein